MNLDAQEYNFRACEKRNDFWYEATAFYKDYFNRAYQFRTNVSEVRFSNIGYVT